MQYLSGTKEFEPKLSCVISELYRPVSEEPGLSGKELRGRREMIAQSHLEGRGSRRTAVLNDKVLPSTARDRPRSSDCPNFLPVRRNRATVQGLSGIAIPVRM